MESTAIQTATHSGAVQPSTPMNVTEIKGQIDLIQNVMRSCMKDGEHYGVIPGCGKKPALLKAGAEKLSLAFRLSPRFEITIQDLQSGHRNYDVRCILSHIITGSFICEGVGSCSTMETKFRYRKAEQVCPECGATAIIRGKKEYGGGWVCFKAKGGCGAKFKDHDPAIDNQEMGRIEHDNPADYWNTCLKMAKKRAHVDAILTATAASDIFTQDIDDSPEIYGGKPAQQSQPEPPLSDEPPDDDYSDPENDKRNEIITWCMEMTMGDSKQAQTLLEKHTRFTGRDGKEVAGVKQPSQISGKRLNIAHGKIHDEYDKWKDKELATEPTKPEPDPNKKAKKDTDSLFATE